MAGFIFSVAAFILAAPLGPFVATMAAMAAGQLGKWVDYHLLGLGPRPITTEGPRLQDIHVQVSSYGAPIQQIWGTMRVAGNLIWARDISEVKVTENISGGCFGSDQTNISYNYYCTFAIGICKGPIVSVLRMWADSKLIVDNRHVNTGLVEIPGLSYTLYAGTETQDPDPTMEALEGAGDMPAFRGMAYIIFKDLRLDQFGNRVPTINFEVCTRAGEGTQTEFMELPVALWGGDDCGPLSLNIHKATRGRGGGGGGGQNIFAVFQHDYNWIRVNLLTGQVVAYVDLGNIGGIDNGWAYDGLEYIYAIGPGTVEGTGAIYRLRAENFAVVNYGGNISGGLNRLSFGGVARLTFIGPEYRLFAYNISGANKLFIIEGIDLATEITLGDYDGDLATMELRHIAVRIDGSFAATAFVICGDSGSLPDAKIFRYSTSGTIVVTDITATAPYAEKAYYDDSTDTLLIGCANGDLHFFDGISLAHVGSLPGIYGSLSSFKMGPVNGHFYGDGGAVLNKVNVAAMTLDETYVLSPAEQGGGFYDQFNNAFWYNALGTQFARIFLDRLTGYSVLLTDIIKDICHEVGLTDDEIDVSELI